MAQTKILVKGNILADGNIASYLPLIDVIDIECGEQNEADFDIVIGGDMKIDSLCINTNAAKIYVAGGNVIALGQG